MGWIQDKAWADQFLPEIEKVVRSVAGQIIEVRESTPDEDQHQATDYIITVTSGDIGCRIRDTPYWYKHGDVTFRNKRPSGRRTEVEKIIAGHARWYLYAWGRPHKEFLAWVFFDLDTVRACQLLEKPRREIQNTDNSSSFISIPISELQQNNCIVASKIP